MRAAEQLFNERSFDDVAIADIARAAGVSQQTVMNHFGSKEKLYLTGLIELVGPEVDRRRNQVRVGDIDSVITIAAEDYEQRGLASIRMLAQGERFEGMRAAIEYGRRAHRDWVAHALGPQLAEREEPERADLLRMLTVCLDVYTWYQLRHMEHRSRAATRADLRRLLTAVLAS
jgi:AcrR family transcriptional regulator